MAAERLLVAIAHAVEGEMPLERALLELRMPLRHREAPHVDEELDRVLAQELDELVRAAVRMTGREEHRATHSRSSRAATSCGAPAALVPSPRTGAEAAARARPSRHALGELPTSFLNARLNAASEP